MMHILRVFLFSFISWLLVVAGIVSYINVVGNTDNTLFVTFHYLLDVFVVVLVFEGYYRFFPHFDALGTTIIAILSFVSIEFIFWNFLYKGSLQFINFTHFFVPMILIGVTIYLIARQYKHVK